MAFFKPLKAPAQTEKKTKAKKSKPQVHLDNLKTLSAINAVMKTLEATKAFFETSVKEQVTSHFLKVGTAQKSKPVNFQGLDSDDVEGASASCEMKKRSTRSVLTEHQADTLAKFGISYDTNETVTTTYLINPKYIDNADLFKKLEGALAKIGAPTDLFIEQVGTPVHTANDRSIDDVFAKEKLSDSDRAMLLEMVTTFAVKTKFNAPVSDALELLKEVDGFSSPADED